MGLSINNEIMQWLYISLLGIIAILLMILIGQVRRVIALLDEHKDFKFTAAGYPSAIPAMQTEGVFEEDLAVIMAVMAKKFPEIQNANIQVRPVKL
jgi:hypothetical protein